MPEKSLDIPVSDLPFEAGKGFSATVDEGGIAHILVTIEDETRGKSTGSISSWIEENEGIFKGVETHAKDDPILEAILDKHAPELLDRR